MAVARNLASAMLWAEKQAVGNKPCIQPSWNCRKEAQGTTDNSPMCINKLKEDKEVELRGDFRGDLSSRRLWQQQTDTIIVIHQASQKSREGEKG
eukprot:10059899-Ditylum_brightwellii.AAC.1